MSRFENESRSCNSILTHICLVPGASDGRPGDTVLLSLDGHAYLTYTVGYHLQSKHTEHISHEIPRLIVLMAMSSAQASRVPLPMLALRRWKLILRLGKLLEQTNRERPRDITYFPADEWSSAVSISVCRTPRSGNGSKWPLPLLNDRPQVLIWWKRAQRAFRYRKANCGGGPMRRSQVSRCRGKQFEAGGCELGLGNWVVAVYEADREGLRFGYSVRLGRKSRLAEVDGCRSVVPQVFMRALADGTLRWRLTTRGPAGLHGSRTRER